MANNEGQYNPRAQAIEEVHFDWKCIVCSMVALSSLHLEQQHLPGTEAVGLNVTSAVKKKRTCRSIFLTDTEIK